MSYVKDLIVADKVELQDIEQWADRVVDWLDDNVVTQAQNTVKLAAEEAGFNDLPTPTEDDAIQGSGMPL